MFQAQGDEAVGLGINESGVALDISNPFGTGPNCLPAGITKEGQERNRLV